MLQNEPKELKDHPGFFEVPGFGMYGLSKDGELLSLFSGEIIKGSVNPDGYHNHRLTTSPGVALTIGKHRLLAVVFKHPGVDITNLTVNHIDGNKSNNHLDNLEWTTYTGNIEHAGMRQLTSKCSPILVRDIYTGETTFFPSINSCANEFGVSKDTVNWRVKKGPRFVFPDGKQYKYYHDQTEWFIPTTNFVGIGTERSKRTRVIVRFLKTSEVVVFEKISDLAFYLKVSPATIVSWLKDPEQLVRPGCIQVKNFTDITPWREPEDMYKELEFSTGNKVVTSEDLVSGLTIIHESAKDCADHIGLTTSLLFYYLKKNDGSLVKGRFKVKYYCN